MKITKKMKKEIIQAWNQGLKTDLISIRFDIPHSKIYTILQTARKHGVRVKLRRNKKEESKSVMRRKEISKEKKFTQWDMDNEYTCGFNEGATAERNLKQSEKEFEEAVEDVESWKRKKTGDSLVFSVFIVVLVYYVLFVFGGIN